MSFQFPEPIPESGFDSVFLRIRLEEYHYELPDYDELIIPLSQYAFNRLSPNDQHQHATLQLEEIRSHHEGSGFTELFKKLNYSDQVKFLSKVLQTLKCERLIPSFKQLAEEHQQEVIEQMALATPSNLCHHRAVTFKNLLRDPEETEEDFRLRRITQLCTDRNQAAHKLIVARKSELQKKTSNDYENNSDRKSCFYEFFLGFSVIWFQGQWASGQDMLIEQLSNNIPGIVTEKHQHNEPEEDFKLRRFTQLCTKVVDFQVQEKFLENAEQKLETYDRLFLEPQGYI